MPKIFSLFKIDSPPQNKNQQISNRYTIKISYSNTSNLSDSHVWTNKLKLNTIKLLTNQVTQYLLNSTCSHKLYMSSVGLSLCGRNNNQTKQILAFTVVTHRIFKHWFLAQNTSAGDSHLNTTNSHISNNQFCINCTNSPNTNKCRMYNCKISMIVH